ncbi:periplasmic binding protein-like I [Powellomyces hirtus]|nr:periplasmic binding protein-like I [Powellomyces hirtus]
MQIRKVLLYLLVFTVTCNAQLKIGVSLTLRGDDRDWSLTVVDAMKLRLNQLLAPSTGVHPALQALGAVTLLVDDSSSSTNGTANVASAIKSAIHFGSKNPVNALIGVGYSDPTEAYASAAAAYSLTVCDGGATSPELSQREKYPNFIRAIPNDNKAALAIVGLVANSGWRKIAITSSTDSYGIGLLAAAQEYINDFGISVLTTQTFVPETTDFAPLINNIVQSEATIIVHLGFSNDLQKLLMEANRSGMFLAGGYQWITGDDAQYKDMSLLTPEERDLFSGVWMVYPQEGVGPAWANFSDAFVNKYINVPTRSPWYKGDETAPIAYSGFYATCIESYVWAYDSALKAGVSMASLVANNHSFAVPADFSFPDRIGVTGNLSIDTSGDRIATYGIYYYNVSRGPAGEYQKFASYSCGTRQFELQSTPLYFAGQTTKPIYDTLQVVREYRVVKWLSALGVITVFLTLISLGALILLMYVVYQHRQHSLFKAASPPFLLTNLVGLAFAVLYPLNLLGEATTASCVISLWLITCGFGLGLGSLLVKIYRLFCIFRRQGSKHAKRIALGTRTLSRILTCVVGIYAILALVWTAYDSPHPVWHLQSRVNLDKEIYEYECISDSQALQTTMQALIFGYTLILIFLNGFFAYVTRKLPARFRESIPLLRVLYATSAIMVFVLSMLWFVPLQQNATHVIQCFGAYGLAASTTLIVHRKRCHQLWHMMHPKSSTKVDLPEIGRSTSLLGHMTHAAWPATKSGRVYVVDKAGFVSFWTERTLIFHGDKSFALVTGDMVDGLMGCRYLPLNQYTLNAVSNIEEETFMLKFTQVDDDVKQLMLRVDSQAELESWTTAMSRSCAPRRNNLRVRQISHEAQPADLVSISAVSDRSLGGSPGSQKSFPP